MFSRQQLEKLMRIDGHPWSSWHCRRDGRTNETVPRRRRRAMRLSYTADQLAFLVRHFQLGSRSDYDDMDMRITQFLKTIDVLKLPEAYLRILNNDYGLGPPTEFNAMSQRSSFDDFLEHQIA
jgi:hypothetical protein